MRICHHYDICTRVNGSIITGKCSCQMAGMKVHGYYKFSEALNNTLLKPKGVETTLLYFFIRYPLSITAMSQGYRLQLASEGNYLRKD